MTPRLRADDLVVVVAPSGPVDPDALSRGCDVLRGLGLRVRLGAHVLDRGPHLAEHLAGADSARAADFTAAWCDPDVSAVVCARGGYGATRVLPHLDLARLGAAVAPARKVLLGSSDATALLAALGPCADGVLGPMPSSAGLGRPGGPEPRSLAALERVLLGDGRAELTGTAVLAPGRAMGPTIGGNLSLLAALAGTPWLPPPDGAVLLLEDVGEAPYRVDRMLTTLRSAGWLGLVAGVALGDWEGCGDVLPVLADRLGDLGVPVLAGLSFGHGAVQLAVPIGAPAVLDADAGTLLVGGR